MKIILCLLFFATSCSSMDIYKDKIYIYSVVNNNSSVIDTLEIKIIPNFLMDKLETKFKYKVENSNFEFGRESRYNSDNSTVSINPPIGGYLNYTELLPYPEINLPPKVGDSIYSEHNVPDAVSLKSKEASGYQKVTGKTQYKNRFIDEEVWVIESYSLDDNNYSAKYYFSPKYGFVYFNYNLGGNKIEVDLIKLETYQVK